MSFDDSEMPEPHDESTRAQLAIAAASKRREE